MATQDLSRMIIEHAATRRGTIEFRRDGAGDIEAIVSVEVDGADSQSYPIENGPLTDGVTVLTAQEKTDLFSALKKLYDHGRDNIPGSTP